MKGVSVASFIVNIMETDWLSLLLSCFLMKEVKTRIGNQRTLLDFIYLFSAQIS